MVEGRGEVCACDSGEVESRRNDECPAGQKLAGYFFCGYTCYDCAYPNE